MINAMTRPRERIGRLDIALTILLSALGALLMYVNVTDPDPAGPQNLSWLAIPGFFVVTIPLLWRSVAPLGALIAVLAGLVVHWALFGDPIRCGVAFPVIGLLAFSAGARLQRRDALIGLAVGSVAAVVVGLTDALTGVSTVGLPLAVVCWGLGRIAHARGHLAENLHAHTEELRVARDERARLQVATDRAQLSGELDALLQRRLGELATLADRGSQSVGDGTATLVLAEIEQESRETLDEMRELVGVLRSDDGAAAVAPQPTLTSLEALLVRAKGADARLTVQGDPRALPAGVELSAYRVVEHLLDALGDAPGVEVHVRFAQDTLELTVEGPVRRRGDVGAALGRARERVELHRGSLRTRTTGGRAQAIVELPLLGGA